MDSQNPFVLILAGQPLIRSKLSLIVNNSLRQRLIVKHIMQCLKVDELQDYLALRIKIASITNGFLRLVNSLVTACLLSACEKKERYINEEIVYLAQSELNI